MPTRRLSPLRLTALLLSMTATSGAAAQGQSELVIHKEGTTLYHRPACPVVQDMKPGVAGGPGAAGAAVVAVVAVVAMTRAQAEARSYNAHPDCDPANPKAPAPKPPTAPPQTVYLDASKYYHRKTCEKLADAKSVTPATLDEVGKSRWPCPACSPPVRKKSSEAAVPGAIRRRR